MLNLAINFKNPGAHTNVNPRCFAFYDTPRDWFGAYDVCVGLRNGGLRYDLVSIDSLNENNFIAREANQRFSASHYLIGLYALDPQEWSCDDTSSFRNWDVGEPSGVGDQTIASRITGKCCYFFSSNSLNWADARNACWQRGYDIASIDDPSANNFIASRASQRFSASHYLIGLYRPSSTSQYWYWNDGNWASYRNWDTNQPTGMGTIAIVSRLTGNWSVNFDDFKLPFVCRSYWYSTGSTEATTSYYWRDENEKKEA
ncbi:hypothetical protein WR25_21966 [Diploscapter pachys]|uniref:C-type lectin domain-containing protein n=1 Tax=Diploscapter pachys TaxID=2018661 RepID=A0A2A2KMI1_9BILA|nr:hypothetical protein WR25_21966 [Diploscapter pachys]